MDETPDTPTPTKSTLRPNRLSAGLLAGGASFAMVLAGLGIAAAQTAEGDGSTTTPSAADATPDARPEGEGAGRPHHVRMARLTVASEVLGISAEDLRTQLQEGKSLATIAGDKTDELIAALVADATTHLDDAVTHGRLTQAEADEKKAGLPERITALVNATPPADGERRMGPGGPGMGDRGPKADLSVVAGVLGISEDEVRTQLQAGKSLATIAGDKTQAVVDALVAAANARLDQAVTDGKLTQAQGDEKKANLTERITALVNRTPGEGPRHHRGPGPGPGAEAPADGETEAAPASVTA